MFKYSGHKWKAVKNSSWGIDHISRYGDRTGYVICYNNKNNETIPLCSVIGQFNIAQTEIDANAILITNAPEMAKFIEKIAFDENFNLENIIIEARLLSERFNF